ncbi:MAG: glycosyltransferase [Fermentimonas sp.]|nr:glycosyltransferase [Fermentimonas sp.]
MGTVYFVTNIAPHYRAPLWKTLLNNNIWNAHFFYSDDSKSGIRPIDFSETDFSSKKERLHKLKAYRWIGKKQIWQVGLIHHCIKGDFEHAIFLGEISRLSTWIAVMVCRMRGIQVAFWSHGLLGGESKYRLMLKKMLFRLAHSHLLYERRAKKLMVQQGFPANKLHVVFNSLDYDTHLKLRDEFRTIEKAEVFPFFGNPDLPILIFVGRLTPVKRLDLLVEAANRINADSTKVNLVIMGDGVERQNLEQMGKQGIENKWLHFTGACYDEREIGKFLSKSDLCVSPGNVGLTAIHSLSFGTPVCTHDNMCNQMPEAGAIESGYNGFFFKENDAEDLKNKIEEWFSSNYDRSITENNSNEIIDKYYNPHYQLTVINRLINGENPEL